MSVSTIPIYTLWKYFGDMYANINVQRHDILRLKKGEGELGV